MDIKNCLDGHSQITVVNSSVFKWRPAMSSVLQGPLLGLEEFNIILGDMDSGIVHLTF